MIIRWIGAILVAGGTAAAGFSAVQRLHARVRLLHCMISALELMQAEIYFKLTPLPRLMEQMAKRAGAPLRPFFAHAARLMAQLGEHSFQSLWNKAVMDTGGEWKAGERELMADLGGLLGRYDVEAQCRALTYTKGRMERLLTDAEAERARQGRVYGALGVAAGLAIVIILL